MAQHAFRVPARGVLRFRRGIVSRTQRSPSITRIWYYSEIGPTRDNAKIRHAMQHGKLSFWSPPNRRRYSDLAIDHEYSCEKIGMPRE
jgi:hypothetical protein